MGNSLLQRTVLIECTGYRMDLMVLLCKGLLLACVQKVLLAEEGVWGVKRLCFLPTSFMAYSMHEGEFCPTGCVCPR